MAEFFYRVENTVGKGEIALKSAFDVLEKTCGKKKECWLPASSPFPTMFSKAFF